MRRIIVLNKKGGVGKTTTAVNLAAALAEEGKRVLLLDLDGQRNSTTWCLGLASPNPKVDILDAVLDGSDPMELVQDANFTGVQIIPASKELLSAEGRISNITAVHSLRKSMANWPDRWDFVLMDCPPDMKSLTIMAMLAATDAIVVSKPGSMDITGIASVLDDIANVQSDFNPNLKISGILLSQTDMRTRASKDAISIIEESYPDLLFTTTIRSNVRFLEAHGYGQPITQYAPTSTGAQDYRALAAEFLSRNGGKS